MPKIPTITKNLLIINVLAFVAMLVFKQVMGIDLNDLLGLHFFMASDFHIYQLFTYMFMHGGWEHIILNMFMLWMFGMVVEQTWGSKRFLFYYIVCGIGAGIMQEIAQFFWVYYMLYGQQALGIGEAFSVMNELSAQLNGLTTVGASGAIYALLLAFGMMFPNERMFIIPIPIPIKAKWMIIGSIAVELFSALAVTRSWAERESPTTSASWSVSAEIMSGGRARHLPRWLCAAPRNFPSSGRGQLLLRGNFLG